jgi:hypothetical protein
MSRWRVDLFSNKLRHLGTVEAPDEKVATAEAAKQFHITPARRNKLVVTKVIVTDSYSNKNPEPVDGRG